MSYLGEQQVGVDDVVDVDVVAKEAAVAAQRRLLFAQQRADLPGTIRLQLRSPPPKMLPQRAISAGTA